MIGRSPAATARRGTAPVEFVMVAAVVLPLAIAFLILCIRASKLAWRIVAPLVDWPYL